MRAGKVVNVRINPKDCMGVIDVVKKAGVYVPGMSFSQMVSLALSGMMQTLRDNEIIPDREGWEYLEMMGPYLTKQNGRKLEVTKVINSIGSALHVRGLSPPAQAVGAPAQVESYTYHNPVVLSDEQVELIEKLNKKMETEPLTPQEQAEYNKIAALI